MFDALLAHPGVTEHCELRSTFGIMAFHGGNLEEMTDVIASASAERRARRTTASSSPRICAGTSLPPTSVPSIRRVLAAFLDHVDIVITVHGYGRAGLWTSLLLGGSNRALADTLGTSLRWPCPPTTSSPTSTRSRAISAVSTLITP